MSSNGSGLGWPECVCQVGVQFCGVHPDRPMLRAKDKEGQIAFRKAWDARVQEAKGNG